MASTAAPTAGSLTHTPHTQCFMSQLDLEKLEKRNYYFFFIINISASNLYMSMIWLYVFLQDFLIPFLCGPDLQCVQ
jgi:hypothetical protein